MLKNVFKIILVTILFLNANILMSQPGFPGDGEDPDRPVPITGIEYLIAAGAAFGAKKVYDKRKKK